MINEIRKRAMEISPLCVGIDLRKEQVPRIITEGQFKPHEHFVSYAKAIVDYTSEYAACYKVQIACYEVYGTEGLKAYSEILSYIRKKGHKVIADIKRSDIGSTAKLYAKAHMSGDFESDAVTLNAYMGEDSVSPYYPYLETGKAAFLLAKTSNPGSKDFEDLILNSGVTLYQNVLKKIYEWGRNLKSDGEFSQLAAVVGVNHLSNLKNVKPLTDKLFLLVPGYGAQGAKAEDIKYLLYEQKNGIVNVSRGITAGLQDASDFEKVLKTRAAKTAEELKICFA